MIISRCYIVRTDICNILYGCVVYNGIHTYMHGTYWKRISKERKSCVRFMVGVSIINS